MPTYKDMTNLRYDIENKMLYKAMEMTYDELLDKLHDFIQQDVYDNAMKIPKTQNPFYVRSEDLLDADAFKAKIYKYNGVNFKIDFNPKAIGYGTDNGYGDWVHGNLWEGLNPETFLGIINGDIAQGDAFNFPAIKRRPFWDDFVEYVNENYSKIIFRNLKKLGFRIKL